MTCSFYLEIIVTFVYVWIVHLSMSVSIPLEMYVEAREGWCDFLIVFYLIYLSQSLSLSLKLFWLAWLARKFLESACPVPSHPQFWGYRPMKTSFAFFLKKTWILGFELRSVCLYCRHPYPLNYLPSLSLFLLKLEKGHTIYPLQLIN